MDELNSLKIGKKCQRTFKLDHSFKVKQNLEVYNYHTSIQNKLD